MAQQPEEPSGFSALVKADYFTLTDGTRFYYELHGSGPQKIVFIAGFHTSILTWKYQVEYLMNDAQRRFQVLLMDNRGYGRSDRPVGLYSIKRMAKDYYELLRDCLHWETYHICGQSMGGMIAQRLAMIDPMRVDSLTLVVTHAGGISGRPPIETIPLASCTLVAQLSSPESHARSILRLEYPNTWLDAEREEGDKKQTNREYMTGVMVRDLKWGCPKGRPAFCGILGQFNAISTHYISDKDLQDLATDLEARGAPVMVIVGSEDSLVRLQNSKLLAKLFECPLVRLDTGGHMLHYQLPDAFNQAVIRQFTHSYAEPSQVAAGGNPAVNTSSSVASVTVVSAATPISTPNHENNATFSDAPSSGDLSYGHGGDARIFIPSEVPAASPQSV